MHWFKTLIPRRLSFTQRLLSWLFVATLLGAGLVACGGADTRTGDGDKGELAIALTDAEGDFVSYTVDVVSISLTKANGTQVETVPISTRVDFSHYTDMTEFLTVATVPAGVYVEATMVLDYSNAEIIVEDNAGKSVPVSAGNILDRDGNVVNRMSVTVKLDGKSHLKIAHNVPNQLTLDFDLAAGHQVNFEAEVPYVTVKPYLLAEVNVDHHKPHRVRGPLKAVQADARKFQINVRPFTHYMKQSHRHFGVFNVHLNDATVFEIDGRAYQGEDGLNVLAGLPQYSAVIALGEVRHHPRSRFDATQVYAGSSVPGGDLDVTQGSVVARSGNVLTVKGTTYLRNDGALTFNDTVEVTLADSTTVLKALTVDDDALGKDDISVGQYVTVFGTLSGGSGHHALNAANGVARLEISHLKAAWSGVNNDISILKLSRINGRDVAQYDFTGTGNDPASDADPNHYEVDKGTLDVSSIKVDAEVRVRGHVTPFGSAPPDFDAITVIDLSAKND